MAYVSDRVLITDDGREVGPFSSHWAACAAIIRLTDKSFESLGGDLDDDLELERPPVEEYPDPRAYPLADNH